MFEFGRSMLKIEDELEFDKKNKNGAKINIRSIAERFILSR